MLFYTYKCQRFFILLSLGFAENFQKFSAFLLVKHIQVFQVFGISELLPVLLQTKEKPTFHG
jgi:hypothetical protein